MQRDPLLLPSEGAEQGAQELDRLRGTSDSAVGKAARSVAGLSPEDEEGRRRSHRDRRRGAWADVETWVIRALGAIGIVLAAGFSGFALYVIWRWIGFILIDPKKTDELVKGTLWTALVALATWGGNNLLRRDD